MKFDLREEALSRTLITAHRGVFGGNIPGNTLDAFDAALCQGADMIELDVSNTRDGELFVFHPRMEPKFLHSERYLSEMTAAEARELHYYNADGNVTQKKLNTLDEALEHLKGRCYINVDKFWDNVEPIMTAIRRHDMMDQVLVKTGPSEEVTACLERVAPDVNYMIIIRDTDTVSDAMLKRRLNYVGAEVLFKTEESELASREYIERMHQKNLLVWVNAIVYNDRTVLAAGHNDDISAPGRMDEGWGWLLDRGYDIIQTDWPMMLRQYMNTRQR